MDQAEKARGVMILELYCVRTELSAWFSWDWLSFHEGIKFPSVCLDNYFLACSHRPNCTCGFSCLPLLALTWLASVLQGALTAYIFQIAWRGQAICYRYATLHDLFPRHSRGPQELSCGEPGEPLGKRTIPASVPGCGHWLWTTMFVNLVFECVDGSPSGTHVEALNRHLGVATCWKGSFGMIVHLWEVERKQEAWGVVLVSVIRDNANNMK